MSPASIDLDDLIRTDRVNLASLVDVGNRKFTIPPNQRLWVWGAKQLSDLWKDITQTLESFYVQTVDGSYVKRPEPQALPHFMGAFVFQVEKNDRWRVIDGQQRLIAISMIASALRERAQVLRARIGQSEGESCDRLIARFSRWLDASSTDRLDPRLQLDGSLAKCFENYVARPLKPEDKAKWLQRFDGSGQVAVKRLTSGFDLVRTLVGEKDFSGHPPMAEYSWIDAVNATMREDLVCVWLKLLNEAFAFVVFDTLNARGTDLGEADKVKNRLFQRSTPAEHGRIKALWDETAELVRKSDMERYIRYWYVAFVDACQRNEVYAKYLEWGIHSRDRASSAILEQWKEDAEWLARVSLSKEHRAIGSNSSLRDTLQSINTLGITYTQPFLMAAARVYLPDKVQEFERAATLARNFAFRTMTIRGVDVSFLESHLGTAARCLVRGEKDLAAVAADLREVDTDAVFQEEFSGKSERRAKVQYYILFELESHLGGAGGLQPRPHSVHQHIEHILPKNLSQTAARLDEWATWRNARTKKPSKLHEAYVQRLGNLLILEASINKHVSNYGFEAKRVGAYLDGAQQYKGAERRSYSDSKLYLPQELAKNGPEEWTSEAIEDRQRKMAKLAVQVWSLKL